MLYRSWIAACTVRRTYRVLVVVCLFLVGCGFGIGAVDGPSRSYPGIRIGTFGVPVGPVSLKLSIDVRYLMTPEVDGMGSYGGLSTAFALNFVL